MKKISLFLMLAIAGWSLTACEYIGAVMMAVLATLGMRSLGPKDPQRTG